MSECVQLVSWVEAEGYWKAEVSIDAVGKLQQEFGDCENVLPVAVLGQNDSGGSSILDKLVGVDGTEGPFSSISGFEGLFVYPKPIPIGKYQLLLMEMSGIDLYENVEKLLMMRKVLLALLSVSAVPIVCLENSKFFDYLNEILGIYGEMQENCHLTVSKFFVGIENETFQVRNSANFEAFLIGKFANICDFYVRVEAERSQDNFSFILSKLQDESLHSLYETTHHQAQGSLIDPDLQEPPSTISSLLTILRALLQLANQDLAWERHIAALPTFIDRKKCWSFIAEGEERQKNSDRLREATAMNFFMKVRDGTQVKLDEVTLGQIRKAYNMNEATVVLTILGGPGQGKSTFLNRVVQDVTGASKCRECFKVGNTTTHTTLNSQVLSQPLRLPGSNIQLMPVDLEGLEGVETINPQARIAQANLISSILTVSSVICIIVKNETDSRNFVLDKLELIRSLMLTFRFVVERIYLLFQDKDLTSGTNPDFERNVEAWNRTYFSGQNTVIKIMNKPSFVASGNADSCKRFLNTLLSDVGFPKKNQYGETINVLELLSNLSYIAPYTESDLRQIQLTEDEDRTAKEAIRKSTLQYERCFNQVSCQMNGESLLTLFRQRIPKTPKMPGTSKACATYIHIFLQLKETDYLTRLAAIERLYLAIESVDISVLKSQVRAYLHFAYQEMAVIDNHHNDDIQKLREKIQNVATRFPVLREKMQELLTEVTSLNRSMSIRYYIHWFQNKTPDCRWVLAKLQDILQLITSFMDKKSALSASCAVAVQALSCIDGFAASEAPMILACAEKIMESSDPVHSEDRWQHSLYTANPIFVQDATKLDTPLDLQFLKSLEEVRDVNVFLAIGRKRTRISLFLNRFLLWIFPFAENSREVFNVKKNTQVCCFPLQGEGRLGLIICLRMKKKTSQRLSKVVNAVMSNQCVSCFFLDPTEEVTTMTENALHNYEPREPRSAHVIVSPGVKKTRELELQRKFGTKNIEIDVKEMNIDDSEIGWEREFTSLREELMSVSPISSGIVRDTLGQLRSQG